MSFFFAGLTIVAVTVVFPLATTLYFLLDVVFSLYRRRRKTKSALFNQEWATGAGLYLLSLGASIGVFILEARFLLERFLSLMLASSLFLLLIASLAFRMAYATRKKLIPKGSLWLLICPVLLGPSVFLIALMAIDRFVSLSPVLIADINALLNSPCLSTKALGNKPCSNKRDIRFVARVSGKVLNAFVNDRFFLSNDGERLAVTDILYSSNGVVTRLPVDVQYPRDLPFHSDHVFSGDGQRFAYREKADNGCVRLVVDGVEGKCYKSVDFPVFSSNGRRLAYVASEPAQGERNALFGKSQFAVIDDKEQKRYAFVDGSSLGFSRNGEHFAFIAGEKRGGPFYLVVDGRELAFPDPMRTPVLSDDAKHFAFISERCVKPGDCGYGFEERVVFDGTAGKGYEKIRSLAILSDPNQIIYLGENDKKTRVVQGTMESEAFGEADLVLSPDGKQFAYVSGFHDDGRDNHGYFRDVFLNLAGRKMGPYQGWLYAAFSSDGDKIAYLVSAYNPLLVIRDIGRGEEKQVSLGLDFPTGSPIFSADGTRIAIRHYYSDRTNWGTISFFSRGKLEGGYAYDWVGQPVFSDDGNSVAYWALDGSKLSYIREHLD